MNLPEETPLKLERGGIYVIEMECRFKSEKDFADFKARVDAIGEQHGVSFIVLECGAKIARADRYAVQGVARSERERQLEERPDYMHQVKA